MSKTVTARTKLPVTVEWVCPACGHRNIQPHTLSVEGSHTAVFGKDEKLKAKAREDLTREIDERFQQFESGKYREANLSGFACAQCGDKPLWTQYKSMPTFAILCIIGGLIALFVNFILLDNTVLYAVCLAVTVLPALVTGIITAAENRKLNRRIAEMPAASRPAIRIMLRPQEPYES